MRALAVLVLIRTAVAEPMLSEFDTKPPREAHDLTLGACQATITLKGAIADVVLKQAIRNPSDHAHSALYKLRLAKTATVIGASLDGAPSTFVPIHAPTQKFDDGIDPLLVTRGDLLDGDTQIYNAITEPLHAQREVELGVHWTQLAEITDGAMRVSLPARLDGSTCMVDLRVQPGPGVRVKVATPRFEWKGDIAAEAQLVLGTQPVVWVQTQDLADGWLARAVTVIAPPIRSDAGPRRVALVIDTSRSMELVGRGNVRRLVAAVAHALPAGSEVQAVMFDRTAELAWKTWQPLAKLDELDAILAKHAAANGSDLEAAFAATKQVLAAPGAPRGQAMVIVISDGSFGGASRDRLMAALGGTTESTDVHALILEPHGMTAPDGEALRAIAGRYGGSYAETPVDDLEEALNGIASWLRPEWQALDAPGWTLPTELRAGTGITQLSIGRETKLALSARADRKVTITGATFAAPIAELVLASPGVDDSSLDPPRKLKAANRHPYVDFVAHDLAVLPAKGTVAMHRKQMIADGGPYTRLVAYEDPDLTITPTPKQKPTTGGSSLDATIIKRLLNDQLQPKAYSCYARSLGRLTTLAGTAQFTLEIGRGEIIHAKLAGDLTNADFTQCLLDAAYGLGPPMPTPGYNVDDRVIVTYPLTFKLRDNKPEVTGSDATQTPSVPATESPGRVDAGDTATPLGGLKP